MSIITDTKDAVQEHWPIAVVIVGLGWFFFLRGGSSGGNSSGVSNPQLSPQEQAMQYRFAENMARAELDADEAEYKYLTGLAIADLDFAKSGFNSLASMNAAFTMENVAAYSAIKDVSISSIQQSADITQTAYMAGAASNAAYFNAMAQTAEAGAGTLDAVAAGIAGAEKNSILSTAMQAYETFTGGAIKDYQDRNIPQPRYRSNGW